MTGGIAAYKVPGLVRRLRERGATVRCALTPAATSFVSPLALEVVSGARVFEQEYLTATGSGEEEHIALAGWADAVLVAPATAHFLARLALGLADDFLSTTLLAFEGPVFVAPAMHQAMWEHPATRRNVETLVANGVRLLGPIEGPLASGEVGIGRMMEVPDIADGVVGTLAKGPLSGRRVLVTAGPTHEPIDPVRFLGNRSSGRMGFAIAEEAAARGAEVILVAGPVSLPTPPAVERVDVVTALEMQKAVEQLATGCDLVVMAAAVGDFRPVPAAHKLKKDDGLPKLELEENPDIVAGLGARNDVGVVVAFAAETDRLEERAKGKLVRKQVDFVVANDVSRSDIGFESLVNEVTVLCRDGAPFRIGRRPKREVATELLDRFAAAMDER